jgi:hypothetical protein
MALVQTIQYDNGTEAVVAFPLPALDDCPSFRGAYQRLYGKDPSLHTRRYNADPNPVYDVNYLMDQDLVVLEESHIEAINSVGLDAFTGRVKFAVVPMELLKSLKLEGRRGHHQKVRDMTLRINAERIVLFDLLKRCGIGYREYVSMVREVGRDPLTEKRIRHAHGIGSKYQEERDSE